jgi:hypothetical protein
MNQYRDKMRDFVTKLWENPNIQNTSISRKENQILNFIKENTNQLKAAFSKPEFFPQMKFDEAVRLLITELTDKVLAVLEPRLVEIVSAFDQNDFVSKIDSQKKTEFDKDKLSDYFRKSLRIKAVRDSFINVLDTINWEFYDRYIPAAVKKHKVIYFEMIRRDRLTFDENQLVDYLKLSSLFRPLIYNPFVSSGKQIVLHSMLENSRSFEKSCQAFEVFLGEEVGLLPAALWKPALESWLHADENPDISGIARLMNILVNRAQEFEPSQKVDRGAETADKSWFNIQRKSAKYYGYDLRFLDELYQIASDEGW